MKQIAILFLFAITSTGLHAQSNFLYTTKGEKIYFTERKHQVIIRAKTADEAKILAADTIFCSAFARSYDLAIATIDTLKVNLNTLKQRGDIEDVAYMLENSNGALQTPTNRIYVKFKQGNAPQEVIDYIGLSNSVEKIELYNPYQGGYLITLSAKLGEVLQICQALFESGLCKLVTPSFLREIILANPYYSDQWGLKNEGQYRGTAGVDINVEPAWNITRGANIKVAVLDEGVDLTHPDLQANLLPGYDALINPPGGANGGHFFNNAHGTACAGIIGANDSITGVAPNSKIVPIRILCSAGPVGYGEDIEIADGIRHAWEIAGADVLSNSWI